MVAQRASNYQGVFEMNSANEATFGVESEIATLSTQQCLRSNAFPDEGQRPVSTDITRSGKPGPLDTLTLTGGVRYDDDRAVRRPHVGKRSQALGRSSLRQRCVPIMVMASRRRACTNSSRNIPIRSRY